MSSCRRREDGVRILSVLKTIWLHQNNKVFNGKEASIEGTAYAVGGFMPTWSSRPGEEHDVLVNLSHGSVTEFVR